MVYLKQQNMPAAYVHCIGDDFSLTPRLTVTSHVDDDGIPVWYLGGELAESGVGKSEAEQIEAAREHMSNYFPWVDVSDAQWHCFHINRAEASDKDKHRPDNASLVEQDNVLVTFPTKLTLTPSLADKLVDHLRESGINPSSEDANQDLGKHMESATIGRAHWE